MNTALARRAVRGKKRVCAACATAFYDLARFPIICPSCGAQFEPAAAIGGDENNKPQIKDSKRAPAQRVPPPTDDDEASERFAGKDEPDDGTDGVSPDTPDDDTVLELVSEDDDVSDLVDTDLEEDSGRDK